MRKILLSAMCIAAVAVPLSARTLSPEEALQRASISGTGIATASMSSLPTLVDTRMTLGMPVYYVFTTGTEGFKILSADDNGAPILGFSDTGTFDPDNVPPSLRYMLDCYAEEIAAAAQNPAPADGVAMRVNVDRASIAPMVSSRWNQGEPYYNMTPEDGGKHCVTGCTATALAQVMYYHKWPHTGEGSISYTSEKIKQNLSINFSDVTFDWDNMSDIYNSTSTQTQKDAVALLMKAVGYSLKMNYGTGESGAYSQYAGVGVWKYFGYDKGASIYYRNLYGIGEWEDMIYNNLRDCGPVLYSGFTNPLPGKAAGGHSFVCDGYDRTTGLFHFNWGWGGMSDGYFALTGLDPGAQGIGGSNSGYNKDQIVILGIRKPAENKVQEPIFGYTTPLEIVPLNEPTRCGFNVYWVGMLSAQESLTGNPGVKIVHPSGKEQYLKSTTQRTYTNETWWGAYSYGWYLSGWADGDYKIYPVFTLDDGATWLPTYYPVGTPRYAILTKTGNRAEVTYPAQATISADELEHTALYTDRPYEVKAMLTNDSDFEYYHSLRVVFTLDGDVKASSEYALVDVLPQSTSQMVVQSTLTGLAAGEYEMLIIDENDEPVSSPVTVTVGTASSPKFSIVSQSIVTELGMEGILPLVNGREFHARATVECTEGYYGGSFYAYIFPQNGGSSIAGFSGPTVYMGKGERVTVDITGSVDGLVSGQKYFALIYANVDNNWVALGAYMYFIATDRSGIESVEADAPSVVNDRQAHTVTVTGSGITSVSVYGVSGAKVAVPAEVQSDRAVVSTASLAPGVYFIKVVSASGTTTEKFIR